ncbi:MAG TPA: ROK family transcriptional regulator [Chloroflexota bacterium]|nr:ROK family transcriptional regulator [Chloroflexota bacterium]
MQKATHQLTKQHNSRLILKMIYDQQEISRADIARETSLTRTTVSSIVADLMDEGLVLETGLGPSIGGKPPRLLRLAEDARQLLCLDLSASYFRGALVNLRGEITRRVDVAVDGRTAAAALSLVHDLISQLWARTNAPLLGIGIGTPGLVDAQCGIIVDAVNLGWHDLPLRSLLEERYDLPVSVGNDSHVAALASYSFDPHDTDNLVLIKAGRGIGAGIVLGGQLFVGDGFGAGEIGHVTVVEDGELCSCGHRGCLETVASIRGILQQVAAQTGQPSPTWEEVVQAAQAGDGRIHSILHQAGAHMGTAVAHLIGILNIQQIVIAGQLSRAGEPFLAGIHTTVNQRVLPAMAAGTHISYTTLGDDVVLMGASALVLKQQLGVI